MRTFRFMGTLLALAIVALFSQSSTLRSTSLARPATLTIPTMHPLLRINPRVAGTLTYSGGLTPQQVRGAYDIAATLQGKGITIAIVDAYHDPTAATDFDAFSRQFGLPTIAGGCGCFQQVNETGGTTLTQITQDPTGGWESETALDIEWAHAIAPQAKILLVEAQNPSNHLYLAEQYAAKNAQVVSNSWGSPEFAGETQLDGVFNVPNVAILVAAGDTGAPASYPSASPYVLSVGGTTLTVTGSCGTTNWTTVGCTYGKETVWGPGGSAGGTGGGASAYEPMPAYQTGFCGTVANSSACGQKRGTPDIAWVANPATGVAMYNSSCGTFPACHWFVIGGTSNSSPSLAGLVADADAARHLTLTTQSLTTRFTYQHAGLATNYSQDYHDVTTGTNKGTGTCCLAGPGWDLTSGLGSPVGANWVANS